MTSAPMPPSSPCNLVCAMDPKTDLCFGCGRSRDEIAMWGSMPEADRLSVMDELPARLQTIERPARRQTRRQRIRQQAGNTGQ